MTDAAKIKDTRRKLEAAGVEYCYASYVDVHGVPKAKVVPLASFEKMAAGSEVVHCGRHGWHGSGRSGEGRMRGRARSRFPDRASLGQAVCLVRKRSPLPWQALRELLAGPAQTSRGSGQARRLHLQHRR